MSGQMQPARPLLLYQLAPPSQHADRDSWNMNRADLAHEPVNGDSLGWRVPCSALEG